MVRLLDLSADYSFRTLARCASCSGVRRKHSSMSAARNVLGPWTSARSAASSAATLMATSLRVALEV